MADALVIVGASYAGVQLAASARELGFEAPIVLLGDERHAPYQRPPLSKGLLAGKTAADQLALRGPDFYAQQQIDLRLGTRVTKVDLSTQRVELATEFNGTATDPFGNFRAGAEATTTISRKDFGLTWNAALEAGGVLVADKVRVDLDVSVIKQA